MSQPLAQLLDETQYASAAVISAYNPYSQQQDDQQNRKAHEAFRDFLDHHSYMFIEGMNIDPAGQWPIEKSFCILGIKQTLAQALGRRFRQNAIVWMNIEAIPRLILLHR